MYTLDFPVEEGLFFLLVPLAVASVTLLFLSWRSQSGSQPEPSTPLH